jgi:DNA-binding LacI/PurR family transcriptional regulator
MRQPMYEMGVLAADVLLARFEEPKREPVHTMFVPKLIVRKTSESLDSRIRMASETAA